jgi:DNA-binding transcriptional MocR family regulator
MPVPMERKVDRIGDGAADPAALAEILGDWPAGPGALYRKLAAALGRAIRAGDLQPGERLPAERRLAQALAVSRATVVAAYDELRGRGIVDSRQGSGTRVSARPGTQRPGMQRPGADGRVPGGRATSIFQRLVEGPGEVISLARAVEAGMPELGAALLEVVRDDLPHLLADAGYHPRGLAEAREAVAGHYTRLGLATSAGQIVLTTGAAQALALAAELYVRRGSTVIVECPSWPGCLDIFRAARAQLVHVPLDEEGIRPEALARALAAHEAALLYVMPTYHNPTGTLMSAARRRQLAGLAERHRVPVLEDNAYGTGGGPGSIPPVAGFAGRQAEILTVGSLSKAVWGGLRTGWIRAPAAIAERLARHKSLADMGSPVLDQALAARLIPRLDHLTARRAVTLWQRRERLEALLAESLPAWRWRRPDGGSALWIELPGTDARVFAQVALRHGVEVTPGTAMDPSGAHDSYIRVPFTFPDATLTELAQRLQAAWADLRRHGPPDPLRLDPIV